MTAWFEQLAVVQSSWFELAKSVPAILLLPFGWQARLPVDTAPDAGPLLQWVEAWKPAHTEDFVV